MADHVNLVKLSVGSESVEALIDWQRRRSKQIRQGRYYHITRMFPKRGEEILRGGSIYWVIKGEIQARQRIVGLEEVFGKDGIRRCAILLDEAVVRVVPTLKRPFQGWRYLAPEEAPRDLPEGRAEEEPLPEGLTRALAEIGVL